VTANVNRLTKIEMSEAALSFSFDTTRAAFGAVGETGLYVNVGVVWKARYSQFFGAALVDLS
jgi:hypothetical protein